MEIKIQSLRFNATESLQAFIEKKCMKLKRFDEDIQRVEVILKVVKPETSMNKQVSLSVFIPNSELFAEKTCDTFEQAVDESIEAVSRQIHKNKEKQRVK